MGFWDIDNYTFETFYDMEKLKAVMETDMNLKESPYYVGITANPMASFQAHGIDIYDYETYEYWTLPREKAREIKEGILALDLREWVYDDESDYLDERKEILCLYLYPIRPDTRQHISTEGFSPLTERIPAPVVIRYAKSDGTYELKRLGKAFDENREQILEEIKARILDRELYGLAIKHRNQEAMELQFGEDCAVILHDPGSCQSGAGYAYRSGSKKRGQIPFWNGGLYPEYMVCRGMDTYMDILSFFMQKMKKPGKRQNVNWAYVPFEKDFRRYMAGLR